jgi:serine phosphatase RsbU (regulator of sigma subunit)/anti-sigma regulatory factor (Ser/Thr protein kinase)/anti-anti-sigma regulatory factor
MENAPAAIYCLAAASPYPVWANARARAMGTGRDDLPVLDGRPVADMVDVTLRTGRAETAWGRVSADAPPTTVVVRPMQVAGGPGVLLVLEEDGDAARSALWPEALAGVVEQVQHSLLPPSLPLLPDLRLSGSYQPATSARAAGGDWYDAVPLGAGRLALVVGDAVGHGVPAASAMSRLRGALRSTAQRDPAPGTVLAALDDFATQMDDVEGASVFYAVLDAATGELTYTGAGHPAPLIVHPDGRTSYLPLTPRPPLGSIPQSGRPVQSARIEQGGTLVLFSDGAVPASDGDDVTGLDRLADVARRVVGETDVQDAEVVAGLADAIAEGVRGPDGWPDDVAVLVAHRRAAPHPPLHLDLLAQPSVLPGVRRRLGGWLTALGMSEQDRVGVMVAVGEACANAAEHAYRGSEPGPMSVTATVDVDGLLTVTVRDQGNWRPPDRDPGDRGRGLLIMRQLVDGVTLEEAAGTTVTMTMRLRRTPELDLEHPPSPTAATVTVDREVDPPVVRISGAVDEIGAEQMRIRLLEASHGGTGRVALDLAGVGLFSSAAVRVVLAIARIARDEGWRLAVHAPDGGLTRHILLISGLGGLVDLL